MNSCANCKFCYVRTDESYVCVRGNRASITGLFIVGRTTCDEHEPMMINVKTTK